MKRIKFLLVFVFLLVGTLTVLAFSSDKYHTSTLSPQCIGFNGYQRPIDAIDLLDENNWSPISGHPAASCDDGPDLCGICFDNFSVTADEAREILFDYYDYYGIIPAHDSPIFGAGGKVIWVYRKVYTDH